MFNGSIYIVVKTNDDRRWLNVVNMIEGDWKGWSLNLMNFISYVRNSMWDSECFIFYHKLWIPPSAGVILNNIQHMIWTLYLSISKYFANVTLNSTWTSEPLAKQNFYSARRKFKSTFSAIYDSCIVLRKRLLVMHYILEHEIEKNCKLCTVVYKIFLRFSLNIFQCWNIILKYNHDQFWFG